MISKSRLPPLSFTSSTQIWPSSASSTRRSLLTSQTPTACVPRSHRNSRGEEHAGTGGNGLGPKGHRAVGDDLVLGDSDDEDQQLLKMQDYPCEGCIKTLINTGELANGQLAHMRRAADLSYTAINQGFDYNDRHLRQNNNGHVAPRAQFVICIKLLTFPI